MRTTMNQTPVWRALRLSLFAALLSLAASPSVRAQTYTVLHRFTGPDGASPYGTLILDANENVYGMTRDGGAHNSGTVFELTGKNERVLYSFGDSPDGAHPMRGLMLDSQGNLYGTTALGGSAGSGAAFKLGATGTDTVLYRFTGAADGDQPQSGLVSDELRNLYGTTVMGGVSNCGTVFRINRSGAESVLHSFGCAADGQFPYAGLARVSNLFYGTTGGDGFHSFGTVFKMTLTGTETVFYRFKGGGDGAQPMSPLIVDAEDNLYGTTYLGGLGKGTVFKVNKFGSETVLYRFTGVDGGADGENPLGGVVRDASGNLYGTTENGGAFNSGTVFKLEPNGHETVLHSFGAGPKDGKYPENGLVRDSRGNLYGTTYLGGAGFGIVFEITP
jgi:uncharacterized repeat protein (TIGR03803 family)